MNVVLTIAALTVREAVRRRVLRAVLGLTIALLVITALGFPALDAAEAASGGLTTGEGRLVAGIVLNLVLFGLSLIAALGTAFLAGPTVSGEIESGTALAVLARPVHRSAVLLGKWLGLAVFGCGFVVVAGSAQLLVVLATVGYRPPHAAAGLALLAGQTAVLLTLGVLLSTVTSPLASGVTAVGLFGATWIAGVVGGLGVSLRSDAVTAVGTVSRVLLPTDGLWRGAMNAFQDPVALAQFGGPAIEGGVPFLSEAPLTGAYLAWVTVWVVVVLALAVVAFQRRDL